MSESSEEKRGIETVIRQGNPELWAKIKPTDRDRLVKSFRESISSITIQQTSSQYSGPIPSPEMLDAYNTIMPDGANRIMRMAEEQSRHRMDLEKQTIASQNKQGERGQIFALVSVICLILAGVGVCILDYPTVGGTIFGTTILGIGAVFAFGKHSMRKNLAGKHT